MNDQIQITKVKHGKMAPRTFYQAEVNGEWVGEYKTKKEALEKANARIQYNAEYAKNLDEQLSWEFE